MPIIAVFRDPTLTQQSYEASVRQLIGKDKAESPSDWPVKGLLAHIAGDTGNGFQVVDVWESEDAFRRFGDELTPVLKSLGIEGEPKVYPAHTIVTA